MSQNGICFKELNTSNKLTKFHSNIIIIVCALAKIKQVELMTPLLNILVIVGTYHGCTPN